METVHKYPYRFKTEKEFVKEFGINWKDIIKYKWNPDGYMDYLLGTEYPYDIDKQVSDNCLSYIINVFRNWRISWDMLIENKPIEPSYKPKEKIIRIL